MGRLDNSAMSRRDLHRRRRLRHARGAVRDPAQCRLRTAAFTDGRSFVRLARDQKPACVLLDLCMPGPSGLEVLKDIDAKSYPAPILMLSGRNDVLNIITAMRNGAFDYLEKQLDAERS